MRDRISIHKLFLPAGVVLLAVGLWSITNYFRLKGPPDRELHELSLRDIRQVTAQSEIPGSTRIDNIWLQTSNDLKIRYRRQFPYSTEVRRLDTNYSLLLDSTNVIWAVKTSEGEVRAKSYFEEYNIEAKSVAKFCGPFLAIMGALLLFGYFGAERHWATAAPHERAKLEVDAHRTRLLLISVGYMILYGVVIAPWLRKYSPSRVVGLLWVLSGGALIGLTCKQKDTAN